MSADSVRAVKPRVPITSPAFKYVRSASTDVRATWLRNGWIPPTKGKQ